MSVVEDILAEMALSPAPEELPCHFMRLPLELRKRIYALLLLPPPCKRVHCSITSYTKQCSPGGRFLASTCKPEATTMRAIRCGTCEWRGGDVHTAVIRTNKVICQEASEVLYENSQYLRFETGYINEDDASFHPIRRLLIVSEGKPDFGPMLYELGRYYFPSLRVLELHFDIDLTRQNAIYVDEARVRENIVADEWNANVELVVDVHIIRAWSEDNSGWAEPITRREQISNSRALELDEKARQMRLQLVDMFGRSFKANGQTLVVRDA